MNKTEIFKSAFTLAEILITLTIIGVIAAITVPALVQRTNKQEYVTALQKAYSTLSQVTNQIIAENGSPKCDGGGWACSKTEVYNMYKKYLNNAKECGTNRKCFGSNSFERYKYLSGAASITNNALNTWSSIERLILADGVQIMFDHTINKNCIASGESWGGTNNWCAAIWVDINGEKKPNEAGRDFFILDIKENGLYPAGCDVDNCIGSRGLGCACKVLREGAMNY